MMKFWEDGKYRREDKVWDDDRQAWMANNQMSWLLKAV